MIVPWWVLPPYGYDEDSPRWMRLIATTCGTALGVLLYLFTQH